MPKLRSRLLAKPVQITRSEEELVEVVLRINEDGELEAQAMWMVPRDDGTIDKASRRLVLGDPALKAKAELVIDAVEQAT